LFANDVERLFVGAQPKEGGMPYFALNRPLGEFYLAYELGIKPRGRVLVLHFLVERLLIGAQRLLARAISEALARADAKYAIADRFDDAKGEYVGLKLGKLLEINLNSEMVLVRREIADAQLAKEIPRRPEPPGGDGDGTKVQPLPQVDARPRPRRFYAKVALDPNRPTPQVSNIAQSILSELDRVRGTKLKLTLDIDAETTEGFPEDVESVVRANAASLRISDFGFEGD
jgi:hypothetical protein